MAEIKNLRLSIIETAVRVNSAKRLGLPIGASWKQIETADAHRLAIAKSREAGRCVPNTSLYGRSRNIIDWPRKRS
jgi:hypothetical protein